MLRRIVVAALAAAAIAGALAAGATAASAGQSDDISQAAARPMGRTWT